MRCRDVMGRPGKALVMVRDGELTVMVPLGEVAELGQSGYRKAPDPALPQVINIRFAVQPLGVTYRVGLLVLQRCNTRSGRFQSCNI